MWYLFSSDLLHLAIYPASPLILPQMARFHSFLWLNNILQCIHTCVCVCVSIFWFDLLAVQGTLKSLLQHHNSKASILRRSDFFMAQLSQLYITGKTIALTIWNFVGKEMSLLFNMLSKFAIAFLPRTKHLKILCLQSLSTVILEPKKIKSATASSFDSLSIFILFDYCG